MAPIRVMPPELALKIAAGEVVERPAAVVKELLDNAIDAGAGRISVEVREGGLKLIRVSDDGCGIRRAELPLAFTSHATSKIADFSDLEQLATLGFRGEALPSIAAVSRVEVQTRSGEEETGARIRVQFGDIVTEGTGSARQGLRISVSDLFGNVPARRKFVRSLRAESGQIHHVVDQYALARPGIHFVLSIDGRITLESPGNGRLADAVAAVHGTEALDQLCLVSVQEGEIGVSGLVSVPALHRANRTAIDIFVNGRPVQNRSLVFALEEAYSGYLMGGRHPVAAIHLSLPPRDVDVNIHPAKSEVRFAHDREVHAVLYRAVANTLLESRVQARELTQVSSVADEFTDPAPLPLAEATEQEAEPVPLVSALPALRVFGQTNQAFIIAEGPQGLYMIDQHAAHERILFDQLDRELETGSVISQPLLEPLSVELTPAQMLALEDHRRLLTDLGFLVEPFGDASCLVRAVPTLTRHGGLGELVPEVLDELQTLPEPRAARERALAMIACKAAVKAGQTLDVQEMREIVLQLERTPRPQTCPHGRPTMIHLSHSQLEREFGRR